jgi:hypothetical protein
MGSKGSTTTYVNQNQQAQQTPNPYVSAAGQQALMGAQNAAQQPFWLPPQPVAGFSPMQQAAFSNINAIQGQAQPWYNQAGQFAIGSQTPITGADVSQYYNPMAANVTAQMENIFGQQNLQNTMNLTQAAGGVGADRIAVGQANMANQQGLAAGQTYANLYQQALQAAQQQKQMQANAAYAMGNLGKGAQAANLQGIQAQLSAGGLQQQLAQAQMMSPYNWLQQQFAYPFQANQYLAGIAGGLGPAMGAQTATQGYQQQTTVPPQPSLISQGLGLGVAGLGMLGTPGSNFAGASAVGQGAAMSPLQSFGSGAPIGYNTSLYDPSQAGYYGSPMYGNRGGRVPGYADGGRAIPLVPPQMMLTPGHPPTTHGPGMADGGGLLPQAPGQLMPQNQFQPVANASFPQWPPQMASSNPFTGNMSWMPGQFGGWGKGSAPMPAAKPYGYADGGATDDDRPPPYRIGQDPPIFPIDPQTDNPVTGAIKIMAEPPAEVIRSGYDRARRALGYQGGGPISDKESQTSEQFLPAPYHPISQISSFGTASQPSAPASPRLVTPAQSDLDAYFAANADKVAALQNMGPSGWSAHPFGYIKPGPEPATQGGFGGYGGLQPPQLSDYGLASPAQQQTQQGGGFGGFSIPPTNSSSSFVDTFVNPWARRWFESSGGRVGYADGGGSSNPWGNIDALVPDLSLPGAAPGSQYPRIEPIQPISTGKSSSGSSAGSDFATALQIGMKVLPMLAAAHSGGRVQHFQEGGGDWQPDTFAGALSFPSAAGEAVGRSISNLGELQAPPPPPRTTQPPFSFVTRQPPAGPSIDPMALTVAKPSTPEVPPTDQLAPKPVKTVPIPAEQVPSGPVATADEGVPLPRPRPIEGDIIPPPTNYGIPGSLLERARAATQQQESGGNYQNVTTTRSPYRGTQHALGAYGIMDFNLPQWSQETLGRRVTPQEFLANPQLQDQIYNHKMSDYIRRFGVEGAGRAWLGGEGSLNAPMARDPLGTTVGSYGQKFAGMVGGAGTESLPGGIPRMPAGATAQYSPQGGGAPYGGQPPYGGGQPSLYGMPQTSMPPSALPFPGAPYAGGPIAGYGKPGWGQQMINLGAAIAGGTSPWAGVNIGRGITEAGKVGREEFDKNVEAQKLGLDIQKHIDEYTRMTPSQEAAGWHFFYDQRGNPYAFNPRSGQVSSAMSLPGAGGQGAPGVPGGPDVSKGPPPGVSPIYQSPSPQVVQQFGGGPAYLPGTGRPRPDVIANNNRITTANDKMADATRGSELGLDEIDSNADKANLAILGASGLGSTLLTPGPGSGLRTQIAAAIASLGPEGAAKALGIPKEAIGAITAMQKQTFDLGAAKTALLGSREAQQVLNWAIQTTPGWEQTEEGRIKVTNAYRMALQMQKDYLAYADEYRDANNGNYAGVQQAFAAQHPIQSYVKRAEELSANQFAIDRLPVDQRKQVLQMDRGQQGKLLDYVRKYRNDPQAMAALDKQSNGLGSAIIRELGQ